MAQELRKIKSQLQSMERSLKALRILINQLERSSHKSYEDVPGVSGTFDGINMVSEDGKKYEVPPNYAAKSRLLFGSKLKMVEEDGKTLFKQTEKLPHKEMQGMVSKKEGQWYVLSSSGSYRISDVAAEFNDLKVNDEVVILVPANNLSAPFAALKRVLRDEQVASEKKVAKEETKEVKKPAVVIKESKEKPVKKELKEKKAAPKATKTESSKEKPRVKKQPVKRTAVKSVKKAEPKEPEKETKKVEVSLDEDDLR